MVETVFTEVVIPLSHLNPDDWNLHKTSQVRCYVSWPLRDLLNRIAGPGYEALWWTREELISRLTTQKCCWGWYPSGPLDPRYMENQNWQDPSNKQTHMTFLFKDPKAALMFKLSWNPVD